MSKQLGLNHYFKASVKAHPIAQTIQGGKSKCSVCKKFIFPQGVANHERMHEAAGDIIPQKRILYGKVKVTGDFYNPDAQRETIEIDDDSQEDDNKAEELLKCYHQEEVVERDESDNVSSVEEVIDIDSDEDANYLLGKCLTD